MSTRSYAGLSVALVVGAVLSAASAAGLAQSARVTAAAAALAAGACAGGWLVVSSRATGAGAAAVTLTTIAAHGLLFRSVVGVSTPLAFRPLHVAAICLSAAAWVAVALTLSRLTTAGRAMLAAYSAAFAVVIGDALLPAARPAAAPLWKADMMPDPDVGFRYRPHSVAATYYPDDPRGYFERSDPRTESWRVEVHGTGRAAVEHVDDRIRVTIDAHDQEAWSVKLLQAPFLLKAGARYGLRFRIRSDRPRAIYGGVGRNAAPWDNLSPYRDFQSSTAWQSFSVPFTVAESVDNARIFFDVGSDGAATEFADVTLVDGAERPVEPLGTARYFVSYRFNELGFRGPDYAVPRPPQTFRILALGDSYAQGVGVHEQDTFEQVLQRSLGRRAAATALPVTYEVINAGNTGYATRDERRSYELFASKYEAQVVLLVMVFNDDISYQDEVAGGYIAGLDTPLFNLTSRWRERRQNARAYDYTASMQELKLLFEDCRERHARLAVVVFRNTNTFQPWFKLLDAVTSTLKGTDVPVLDLGPAVVGSRNEADLTVHKIDGHPNEIAHALAAQAIESFLDAHGLLPR